jgi:predicted metal-dependent hydrolase
MVSISVLTRRVAIMRASAAARQASRKSAAMRSNSTDNFTRGIEQFNRRQFFESHESWEEVWLRAPEPDKTFLQGIIQVAAALHHNARGNCAGAESLMHAGLNKLEKFPEDYRGLQLEVFRVAVRECLAMLADGEPLPNGMLPRIETVR